MSEQECPRDHTGIMRPVCNEDWERQRTLIKQLYLVQNMKLKDVMVVMERDHKFKATTKMYKTRIKKWGFDQKHRRRNASAFTTRPTLSTSGETPVAISGRRPATAPPHDSYEEHDETLSRDLKSPFEMSFRDQSIFTPVTTPQSPTFPESFANIEELYQEIDRYFATSFESKVWISEGDDVHCHSVTALETTRDVISSFKNSLITACNLVAHGDEGVLYMVKGSSKIKDIVKAGSPEMIPDLLELALWLIRRDRFEIVRIILQQFADMSAVYRDRSCHIYRILAQYSTSLPAAFEKIAFNAWRRIVDTFQRVLGELHVTSLKCRLGYLTQFANSPFCDTVLCLFSCDYARTSEKLLRNLLRKADDHCRGGPNSVQSEMVLQALVNIFLARPAYAELEATGQDIMRRAETETTGYRMLFMALKSMSEAQMSQRKFAVAEPHLRRLVDLSAQTYG